MGKREELLAVSSIDGRYAGRVESLVPIASEFGLIQRRIAVEAGWLKVLGSGILPDRQPLTEAEFSYLDDLVENFQVDDALGVKDIEAKTNHDVQAVVEWMKRVLGGMPGFEEYIDLIHFGATSEDINNLAYALMVRDAKNDVIIPNIRDIAIDLNTKATDFADLPMLGRTHGQPATPTTLGKEMAVYHERLARSLARLGSVGITGKFNGATGGYNAVSVAYPEVDWPKVSKDFVGSLGFDVHLATNQIEPHDWMVAFSNELALNNQILKGFSIDMWLYIMQKYFTQRVKKGEVGSSTMPQKVNPIDYENARSNFASANTLLGNLAAELPISFLQRDLSDSSTQRTIGEAFGHTVIAHNALKRGLGKVDPNVEAMLEDLDGEWGVLAEPLQIVMRRHGVEGAYDMIKEATRGEDMSREAYLTIVEGLAIPEDAKDTLRNLTPATYVGRSAEIARREI